MKLLSQVKSGKISKPELILLYGVDKVGKSTFASQAPQPIYLGTEDGTSNLDVARFPAPKTFDDILQSIHELATEKHPYKTLVIDSLDWAEPLIFEKVCKDGGKQRIEDFGYGIGYKNSLIEWRKLIRSLEDLQNKTRMGVILIAHSELRTFNDPQENASYDRYQLKLYEKTAALFREFCDCIFFANFEVSTHKDKGDRKHKAFGDGNRKIYTERRPAFDAGNRYGLPFELALSWKAFTEAKEARSGETLDELKKSITGLIENIKDKEILTKATESVEKAGDSPEILRNIKRRLLELCA